MLRCLRAAETETESPQVELPRSTRSMTEAKTIRFAVMDSHVARNAIEARIRSASSRVDFSSTIRRLPG